MTNKLAYLKYNLFYKWIKFEIEVKIEQEFRNSTIDFSELFEWKITSSIKLIFNLIQCFQNIDMQVLISNLDKIENVDSYSKQIDRSASYLPTAKLVYLIA